MLPADGEVGEALYGAGNILGVVLTALVPTTRLYQLLLEHGAVAPTESTPDPVKARAWSCCTACRRRSPFADRLRRNRR